MIVHGTPDRRGTRGAGLLVAAIVLVHATAVTASAQPLAGSVSAVGAVNVPMAERTRPDAEALRRGAPGLRRADGWKLGALAAAAALVATADRRGDAWARRPGVRDDATLRALSRVGDASGKYAALGVGPAAWMLGRVRGDSGTAVLGLRTTEAAVLSVMTIGAIKAIAGRTRPYASADQSPTHWDLLGGIRSDSTRSFASGHAAFSAAAAVTLAAEWRRQGAGGWQTVGPPLVYALASLTAASRVRDRQHWLSDVVTGSAVGIASALIVRRWHDRHPGGRIDRTFLAR
ncbi:MAG: phosphatase PAP2 family protein [Gemmatimonadaceae bacterium]|nr:phosphatase PAP2 family protein [Gemmatimonadaceae bacterium]